MTVENGESFQAYYDEGRMNTCIERDYNRSNMQLQRSVPTFHSLSSFVSFNFFFPVAVGPMRFALLLKFGSICLTEEKRSWKCHQRKETFIL